MMLPVGRNLYQCDRCFNLLIGPSHICPATTPVCQYCGRTKVSMVKHRTQGHYEELITYTCINCRYMPVKPR